jgi:hypothetical protein
MGPLFDRDDLQLMVEACVNEHKEKIGDENNY